MSPFPPYFRCYCKYNGFAQQQQQTGTAHVKYNPLVGTDVMIVSGTSQNINTKHHCITCMNEYEGKSLEELRLEDYTAGRKRRAPGTGLFGGFSAQPESMPLFGASGGFGQQQQQTGTAHVKYNPLVGTDVMIVSGTSQIINTKHHCITCMKEYEGKSLEELRLEDYTAGRKGRAPGTGLFGGFSAQPESMPLFGASGAFIQQQQQTGTAHVKYNPLVGTDVMVVSGTSQIINTKHYCITCMKEYEAKSLEELRLEDYTAGRKGPTAGTCLSGGFSAQLETKPLFGASGGFVQQQQQTRTAHVKYNPLVDTDVMVVLGISQIINTKRHCITCMKEYEGKSLEELRLEDHTAGRKGRAPGADILGGFSAQSESMPLFGASGVRQPAITSAPGVFGDENQTTDSTAGQHTPGTSCTSGTPDDLSPLSFHSVHGVNVMVSRNGSVARLVRRYLSPFTGRVAYSARPVKVNEKVCIRFVWAEGSRFDDQIYFGFTAENPSTLKPNLVFFDPDLLRDYWAKPLERRYCKKDNIFYYYVNSNGDVHFGINGEDKGLFFSGVDTRNPLWALINLFDVYTAVQFVDPIAPNQIRTSNQSPLQEDGLVGSMRSLSMEESLPPLRYQSQAIVPLSLHRTKGRNIQFINDRGVAARIETEFCQGYVFTARPMRPGQKIVVQILATATAYVGSLTIGLTSCDPAVLRSSDLPDDPGQLLDRPEYWTVRRDTANGLRRGDELAVTLTLDGEVRVSRNGSNPMTVMHVDHTVSLWAFVDLYGATQTVRLLSSQVSQQAQTPPSSSRHQPIDSVIDEVNLTNTECTICYENPIDSVLYKCGHMCMCYRCAVQQWKEKGNGQCPMCREQIKDVIRTYKS